MNRTATYHATVCWLGEHWGHVAMENGPEMKFSAPPDAQGHERVLTPEDAFVAAANTGPLGLEPILETKELGEDFFRGHPSESNRISVAGRTAAAQMLGPTPERARAGLARLLRRLRPAWPCRLRQLNATTRIRPFRRPLGTHP